MATGRKDDSGKPRWSLLPSLALQAIMKVLDHGARKYGEGNWRHVSNHRERYFNAAMRHLLSWWGGEVIDEESGVHHLAHAATSLMFLVDMEVSTEESEALPPQVEQVAYAKSPTAQAHTADVIQLYRLPGSEYQCISKGCKAAPMDRVAYCAIHHPDGSSYKPARCLRASECNAAAMPGSNHCSLHHNEAQP